jgi:hypothetical protein
MSDAANTLIKSTRQSGRVLGGRGWKKKSKEADLLDGASTTREFPIRIGRALGETVGAAHGGCRLPF